MSDERKYTEREYALAQREAFERGIYTAHEHANECLSQQRNANALYEWKPDWQKPGLIYDDAARLARAAYPLPKVTRLRVVADPHVSNTAWKIRDGELVAIWGPSEKPWSTIDPDNNYRPTPERIKIWADLLANPTEEIECA